MQRAKLFYRRLSKASSLNRAFSVAAVMGARAGWRIVLLAFGRLAIG